MVSFRRALVFGVLIWLVAFVVAFAIFPPTSSSATSTVRVAFAGHRKQECEEDPAWSLRGAHPLAGGVPVGPSTFQFGYDLIGGAYSR